MARVAIPLAADFEDVEFQVPYDRLIDAGHQVTIIGTKKGETVKGKKGNASVRIDATPDEVDPNGFDAVFIPGGYSPDKLRTSPEMVSFVRQAAETERPVAFICHAGSLLIEADAVRNRKVTSWPSIRKDLVNAGAEWEDSPLVEDGNFISSRNPGDLEVFTDALLRRLG